MNRLICFFPVLAFLLAACSTPAPTPAPTATHQFSATATLVLPTSTSPPTATATSVPPTVAATNTIVPTLAPTDTPLPPTATATPTGPVVTATWTLMDAATNKPLTSNPLPALEVNGISVTGDAAAIPDPRLNPVYALVVSGQCVTGYYLDYTKGATVSADDYHLTIFVNGPATSDCPESFVSGITDATWILRNVANGAFVTYPKGTLLVNNLVKAKPLPMANHPEIVGNWTMPLKYGLASQIGIVIPNNGPICHHKWTAVITPGYSQVYLWVNPKNFACTADFLKNYDPTKLIDP